MPINVFGNSNSDDNIDKIDTSLFVQKPYLRSIYIEANIEEDIDLKYQYRIENLPDLFSIREACNKNYVDNIFRNDIDFKEVKLEIIIFVSVNYQPAVSEHLTPEIYVDIKIDEPTLVRNNQDIDFGIYNLININSSTLNKPAENDSQVITNAYVDQFHSDNERNRRDVGFSFYNEEVDSVKINQDKEFNDNKLTNTDSITVNGILSSDNELTNKKYIDNELDKNTILRFNQTLQNYLKVSVGNDIYNLTKYDKTQITDITNIISPNTGGYLLQKWDIKCNDKNNTGKIQNFVRSTNTNSPTCYSGATTLPPIGSAFMYIETSSNNHGTNVYYSWERTDIIQITNITFYYNRFSIVTKDSIKSMVRFRIQLLLEDNSWSTQYTISKNDQ